ncbi:MAG: hypothetical protein UT77_C0001G0014 [Candidatus Daviesbacteria bacterium GW2011_GWC2_40_12]|uniref:Uncharacterized protein n=1 Tax=Candidatus Daviesbacteria bacterium GW2011_GWC2_40_12 TaxID=1618431 RepID=A0A0G0QQZ2_9BACT|nr:MAG: hypothetical protein UT77_C0001G0014 [Candidatus Daviesbacteria bacterium GW2011_GWC2_40_12]
MMAKVSRDEPLLEFNPKLPKLSKNEQAVLKLLVEAGRLIVPIYLEQEKLAQVKIDKAEIERSAKKDPSFSSPYTSVERLNGKLVAIPYHIKYAAPLKPVADKLNEAANISDNKEFGKALKIQAKVLLDGNYEKAWEAWLKMKPNSLDISIGPLHHLANQFFFPKAAYHAWVGVMEKEGTIRFNNYKTVTLSARRKTLTPKERIDPASIKAIVLDAVLFAGIMARTKFVGLTLPIDVNVVEKYGVQATLFNQPNDLRLKDQILPTFNKIFSKGFKEGFSKEDLRRGYLRSAALHDLAHSYLYYKNAAKNLGDDFYTVSELAATVLGLRLAGYLLLKDRITEKMLESMIVAFISRSVYLMREEDKDNKLMSNYTLGSRIFMNFMFESGALKEFKDLIIVNFTKVFVSINDLSSMLESLLAHGTKVDAGSFVKKYSQ